MEAKNEEKILLQLISGDSDFGLIAGTVKCGVYILGVWRVRLME
jgi:hypothetical protein